MRRPQANDRVEERASGRSRNLLTVPARALSLLNQWQTEMDPYRQNALQAQLDELTTDDNAATIFKALPEDLTNTSFALRLLERWAGADRQAALKEIASLGMVTDGQLNAVVRGWALQDKSSMDSYLSKISEGDWKDRVVMVVSSEIIGAKQPQQAIDLLRQMQPSEMQEILLRSAAFKWAEDDPAAASTWALKITDLPLQYKIVGGIARGYAMADPKAAADWLLQFSEENAQEEALNMVIHVWAQEHASKGLPEWIAALPDGERRQKAFRQLSSMIAQSSP